MSVFEEIKNDLVSDDASLSSILRKTKIVASRLQYQEFEEWIDCELGGYPSEDKLPDYRKGNTISCGNFFNTLREQINDAQIQTSHLPEKIHDYATNLAMTQGVGALANLLSTNPQDDTIKVSWPTNLARVLSNQIYEGFECHSAYHILPKNFIQQILEDIRTRSLSFILAIEKEFPVEVQDEAGIGKIPSENVRQVFEINIFGGNQSISQIQQNQGDVQLGDKIELRDVEQSVILTRGSIAKSVKQMQNTDQPELAEAISSLSDAIQKMHENELSEEQRQESFELLEEISAKATMPNVVKSVLRTLGEKLLALIGHTAAFLEIKDAIWPIVEALWL
jgi:hypothetical protein